jgi:hypothetical protein
VALRKSACRVRLALMGRCPTSLGRNAMAGAIQQDAPHHLSRNGEEVGTVLPVHVGDVDQFEVRLVNQRGSLRSCGRGVRFCMQCPAMRRNFFINTRRELGQGPLKGMFNQAPDRCPR